MKEESLKKKAERQNVVSDPNQLAFKVLFGVSEDKNQVEQTFEYALNMRNYIKSSDVSIKSIIELR
jgi:hypothetical protein